MLTRILLTLFVLNAIALVLAGLLWRNKDIAFGSFLMAGTFICRDLPKYIKKEKIKGYLALSYSGIAVFILLVLSMILISPP
jgi:hypothetical protein